MSGCSITTATEYLKRFATGAGLSGDQVRRQAVLDLGDLVAQRQLALLQPCGPQLVGLGQGVEGQDGGVEVLVLHTQPRQPQALPRRFVDVALVIHGPRPEVRHALRVAST